MVLLSLPSVGAEHILEFELLFPVSHFLQAVSVCDPFIRLSARQEMRALPDNDVKKDSSPQSTMTSYLRDKQIHFAVVDGDVRSKNANKWQGCDQCTEGKADRRHCRGIE